MKAKVLLSIRWKLIFIFTLSIALAMSCDLLLLALAYYFRHKSDYLYGILRELYYNIGIVPPSILLGIFFFVLFFFILSKGSLLYLEEISGGLQEIAQGKLDIEIPRRSADELGDLAENINLMTRQLKIFLEEERNAEKMKNELITSVSHDLRTPLTSILGYLELIEKDRYRDELELRHYVSVAYDKALRLRKLIDGLFEYTKVSYGGLELKLERINLKELLEQLAEEFVPVLQEAGMEYRLTAHGDKIFVLGDGDMLARVFENLIANAIRYGREGKFVDISLDVREDKAVVNIINYGETIPQLDLPYIFERFYRVERSRSEQTGGSGLGLAIAKNIIQLHKGLIKAYSSDERTVFEVRLNLNSTDPIL